MNKPIKAYGWFKHLENCTVVPFLRVLNRRLRKTLEMVQELDNEAARTYPSPQRH